MENKISLVLILMILGHLLADYTLQGWLAQAKSKSFWENAKKENKLDYIPALVCHSLMWSILILIPIIWFDYQILNWFWISVPINAIIHCIIDDLKANKKIINLWQDQVAHLCQIVITWLLWIAIFY